MFYISPKWKIIIGISLIVGGYIIFYALMFFFNWTAILVIGTIVMNLIIGISIFLFVRAGIEIKQIKQNNSYYDESGYSKHEEEDSVYNRVHYAKKNKKHKNNFDDDDF